MSWQKKWGKTFGQVGGGVLGTIGGTVKGAYEAVKEAIEDESLDKMADTFSDNFKEVFDEVVEEGAEFGEEYIAPQMENIVTVVGLIAASKASHELGKITDGSNDKNFDSAAYRKQKGYSSTRFTKKVFNKRG